MVRWLKSTMQKKQPIYEMHLCFMCLRQHCLFFYNILQLNEVADFTSKLNLKNKIMNTEKTSIENENQPSCLGAVISWYRKNQDTLLLIAIGLFFQLIFFIGVIISGSCV